MKIIVTGDSWAWDWSIGRQGPGPFVSRLQSLGKDVECMAHPGTSLLVAEDVIKQNPADLYIVFATDAVRNLQKHHWDLNNVPHYDESQWLGDIRATLKSLNLSEFTEWYEHQQNSWLDRIEKYPVIVLGGCGTFRCLRPSVRGIQHVLHELYSDAYPKDQLMTGTNWIHDCMDETWHPEMLEFGAVQCELRENAVSQDKHHLTTAELHRLADIVHNMI